jgi:hypothetical protein
MWKVQMYVERWDGFLGYELIAHKFTHIRKKFIISPRRLEDQIKSDHDTTSTHE